MLATNCGFAANFPRSHSRSISRDDTSNSAIKSVLMVTPQLTDSHPTLRLSGSPKLLNKEAHSWRVRSKRFAGAFDLTRFFAFTTLDSKRHTLDSRLLLS